MNKYHHIITNSKADIKLLETIAKSLSEEYKRLGLIFEVKEG